MKCIALCAVSLVVGLSADICNAHGGRYAGPGDVVPPGGYGPGGRSPGARPVTGPRPPGPVTGGAGNPGTGGSTGGVRGGGGTGRGGTTGGGIVVGPDLGRWQFWWEFNKDPYLNLKEAIHASAPTTGSAEFYFGYARGEDRDTLAPTNGQIHDQILPALRRALDATDQRDIVSSCLVALAKIGLDHDSFEILPLMRDKLRSHDQEISETAALAMGISQMPRAIPTLADLALDSPTGRQLCDRSSVNYRTRAFSCYALGLIAHATAEADSKRRCFEVLRTVLDETFTGADRNVPVAAIHGIRLVRPNPEGGAVDRILQKDCLDALMAVYRRRAGPGQQQIQAHAMPAIAQLLGRGGDRTGLYEARCAGELTGEFGKRHHAITQSAAIALGLLCRPAEVDADDAPHSAALLGYFRNGKDEQTRSFCLLALGQIGGDRNRGELLKILSSGGKAVVRPWAAIALGVLAHHSRRQAGDRALVDTTLGRELLTQLDQLKNDETRAALAIALGLTDYRPATDKLRALLRNNKHKDQLAGYLCIALALLDDREAAGLISDVARAAVRRPELLQQAAIALGKLGNKEVTVLLQDMLTDPSRNLARLSAISAALGFIGDQRSVRPLIVMLEDESITPLSRAFAAVALGGVADKEPLPWNAKIRADINYRAAVETLTNQISGVLDIL